jgi:hypothetical protein
MPLMYPVPFSAAPYGLEVQFTYNNLTMNANKFNHTAFAAAGGAYYIDEIGGLDDADIRSGAEARPDSDGENPLNSYYGGKTITLSGWILAQNMYQLRIFQQNLREAFGLNLITELPLTMSTGIAANDIFLNCRKNSPLQMREAKRTTVAQHARREFMISLRASYPFWQSSTQASVASATNPANLATISTPNNGNYYAWPVITIHGPFSAGLQITNTNGRFIKLDTALLSTNTLVIDTRRRTVLDSQNANANRYTYLDPTTTWPYLDPGAQNFTLSGVAGGSAVSQVTIAYRHAFL